VIEVRNVDDLRPIEAAVRAAAERAATEIRATTGCGLDFLRRLKFADCGRHPVEDRCLNLIEQVNQTFTYLATCRAAEKLFELHPDVPGLRLNVGTAAGTDIEDVDRTTLAAEVFAAVDPRNNRKLAKDIAKVAAVAVPHRYVFFASPCHPPGRRPAMERSGVQVWAVEV
jgi:hypothetical protein